MKKIGFTNWSEVEFQKKGFENNKDLYLRLENGENRLRVCTKPAQYFVHQGFKDDPEQKGFGDRIMCSTEDDCPVCKMNHQAKMRWLVGVIDRRTQSFKILDITQQIFEGIQALTRMEEYGATELYDLNIIVNKSAGPSGYYRVIAFPPKPMSDADLAIKKGVDLEEMARRCQAPTNAKVQERLEKIRQKNKTGNQPVKKTKEVEVNTDEAEDYDFPAAPSAN